MLEGLPYYKGDYDSSLTDNTNPALPSIMNINKSMTKSNHNSNS